MFPASARHSSKSLYCVLKSVVDKQLGLVVLETQHRAGLLFLADGKCSRMLSPFLTSSVDPMEPACCLSYICKATSTNELDPTI